MQYTMFDKAAIYKKEIMPLLQDAMRKCLVNDIPFFVVCATKQYEKDGEVKVVYENEYTLPGSMEYELSDDRFARHICVARGFETVPPGGRKAKEDPAEYIERMMSENDYLEGYQEEIAE